MQIGRTRLSPQERQRRIIHKCYLYCGSPQHLISHCPILPIGISPSVWVGLLVGYNQTNRLTVLAILWVNKTPFQCSALVDSDAKQNVIDPEIIEKCSIPVLELKSLLSVSTLDGSEMDSMKHQTQPVQLIISGNHNEELQSYAYPNKESSLVLSFPWLTSHNPQINWSSQWIDSWGDFCSKTCLTSALPAKKSIQRTAEPDADLSNASEDYYDLHQVFRKDLALSLPPYRPYDWPINLLPGALLPSGRLFKISVKERKAILICTRRKILLCV